MQHILIVEDDLDIQDLLRKITLQGFWLFLSSY